MSETKHTPGPWKVAVFGNQVEVIVNTTQSICSLCRTNAGHNARLIAAAPDLLTALKRLAAVYPWECGDPDDDAVRVSVNAAIAKADEEGEPSCSPNNQ